MKGKKILVMAAVAAALLVAVPALAVNWVQVGSTIAGPYSTPDVYTSGTGFSAVGTAPSAIGITGGVLNDFKVTYHLYVQGITGWDPQQVGDGGLVLFAGSSPAANSGLFTGVYITPVGDNRVGSYTADYSEWGSEVVSASTELHNFDVTVEAVGGVVTTTAAGFSSRSYTPTTANLSSWANNVGFAAFHCGPGWPSPYVKSVVSNISFYTTDAGATPEPSSLFAMAMGVVTTGGFFIRRRRS